MSDEPIIPERPTFVRYKAAKPSSELTKALDTILNLPKTRRSPSEPDARDAEIERLTEELESAQTEIADLKKKSGFLTRLLSVIHGPDGQIYEKEHGTEKAYKDAIKIIVECLLVLVKAALAPDTNDAQKGKDDE